MRWCALHQLSLKLAQLFLRTALVSTARDQIDEGVGIIGVLSGLAEAVDVK